MKDRLKAVLEGQPAHRLPGLMREFLQCMALRVLHEHHHFGEMAFVGGTALRLIYGLPRFSEDLDFSLVEEAEINMGKLMGEMNAFFAASGIAVESSLKKKEAVCAGWLSFPKLLHEMGVSRDPRRVLSIKLEIDCRPPSGAHVERRLINRHFPLAVVHYDLPSLFAGKLHAVLTRPYVKGRDFYDLVWYRTRHVDLVPNLDFLNAALRQTGWKGDALRPETWRPTVKGRIARVDWSAIVRDVSPFLEDEGDLTAMTLEYVVPLFE
jgi:Nucleotidyl transferase AbiEii toxin, Type IV TA system